MKCSPDARSCASSDSTSLTQFGGLDADLVQERRSWDEPSRSSAPWQISSICSWRSAVRPLATELFQQPQLGEPPVAFHRVDNEAEAFRRSRSTPRSQA